MYWSCRRAGEWYARQNRNFPMVTKSLSTCALFSFSDVLCQGLERLQSGEKKEFAWGRCLRMGGTGLLWTGPVLHVYYRALPRLPLRSPLQVTAFDQTAGAVVLTSGFFFGMGAIEGVQRGGLPAAAESGAFYVREQLWPTLLANWAVWPFLQYCNFRYIPLDYRVLFTSSCGVVWNIYLSFRANMASGHCAESNHVTLCSA
eukprot:Hpha_TRINITY_DN11262_c0_g1::TRINITY_DN11262_c0_g1_i1::g.167658::m.167658/K13348/MPV17; protein Mpv17